MSGDPSETIAKEIKEYLEELKPETSSLKEDLSETCPVKEDLSETCPVKETIATKIDFDQVLETVFLNKPYISSDKDLYDNGENSEKYAEMLREMKEANEANDAEDCITKADSTNLDTLNVLIEELPETIKKYFSDETTAESLHANKPNYSKLQGQNKKRKYRKPKRRIKYGTSGMPNKFFHNGTINDPLNLGSVTSADNSPRLSPETVKIPNVVSCDKPVDVRVPVNLNDPLRLMSEGPMFFGDRVNHKKRKCEMESYNSESSFTGPSKSKKLKLGTKDKKVQALTRKEQKQNSLRLDALARDPDEVLNAMVERIKFKNNKNFIYGNYSRYYGYRCKEKFKDNRMNYFNRDWFKDKDVLDIGCNSGQLTLLIARDYCPRKIVGIDIDQKLINIARNNIAHYSTSMTRPNSKIMSKYPTSFTSRYGAVTAAPLETGAGDSANFPQNVLFFQGNYVPETNVMLDVQEPEYDVIMCLSVTKWMHLNWGDEALVRTFKRMYKQLRSGGKLILEPQEWKSYGKKNKLTENIFRNYHQIKLKPEQFRKFLSEKVGFTFTGSLRNPNEKAGVQQAKKGFQRQLLLFTKPE